MTSGMTPTLTGEPHSLPVSTVQALIDQWRVKADAVIILVNGGYEPTHELNRAYGWRDCADQLAALLASPSLHREEDK